MTSSPPSAARAAVPAPGVIGALPVLDRFLPVWIVAAMAAGLLLGRLVPGLNTALEAVKIGGVSLPIALGLLLMMYPVLAKVRYDRLGTVTGDRRLLISPLLLNWVLGPAVMFALAWMFLPDLPEYRTGLIIVGLARCIAMVLIWNDLACGNREAAAVLVAVNSVFQVIAFGALGWFYLRVLPGWLGLPESALAVSAWDIAFYVLVFLGVPLAAGYASRKLGERARGRYWYEQRFLPRVGPIALYGLLFTIVILFALQGHTITSRPGDVARIALPLLAYFALMWGGGFAAGKAIGLPYDKTTTLAFTAAGNNFELAIAVAVGVFGITSGQALAGVVGPLIEGSSPLTRSRPRMWSSPWAAGMSARSSRASGTRTGNSTTPPGRTSRPSARSVTTSAPGSKS
ncbi:ACR3 family arsenite efflux transporter [Nonomuraea phyllanthi]|uniref:ACR3 family arsenite efflux transporter n=1 Tax=Nonomuraea phyllanthi TaxID=2219224 RepID=UPI001D009D30|nr:ACR3 family arsenite efflux transporter [Nonomuraea phyllanthi]